MPIHEYHCPHCDWSGDRIVKDSDKDDQACDQVCWDADSDEKVRQMQGMGPPPEEHNRDGLLASCFGDLERVEISRTGGFRIDSRFQMAAITSSGKKVEGNFGGGVARKAPPVFTQGVSPSRADMKKHAHKAYKATGKHYPGRKKAEKKS